MKDGEQNIYVDYVPKKFPISVREEVLHEGGPQTIEMREHDTLVLQWGSDIKVVGRDKSKAAEHDYTDFQRRVLSISKTINEQGEELPAGLASPGLRGVKLAHWYTRLVEGGVLKTEGGRESMMFTRLWRGFAKRGAIQVNDEWVWIPLSDP
jgi:hypothetical protein